MRDISSVLALILHVMSCTVCVWIKSLWDCWHRNLSDLLRVVLLLWGLLRLAFGAVFDEWRLWTLRAVQDMVGRPAREERTQLFITNCWIQEVSSSKSYCSGVSFTAFCFKTTSCSRVESMKCVKMLPVPVDVPHSCTFGSQILKSTTMAARWSSWGTRLPTDT